MPNRKSSNLSKKVRTTSDKEGIDEVTRCMASYHINPGVNFDWLAMQTNNLNQTLMNQTLINQSLMNQSLINQRLTVNPAHSCQRVHSN